MHNELTWCCKGQKDDFLLLLGNYHHYVPLNISRKSSFPQAAHHSITSFKITVNESTEQHKGSPTSLIFLVELLGSNSNYALYIFKVYSCPHFKCRNTPYRGQVSGLSLGAGGTCRHSVQLLTEFEYHSEFSLLKSLPFFSVRFML